MNEYLEAEEAALPLEADPGAVEVWAYAASTKTERAAIESFMMSSAWFFWGVCNCEQRSRNIGLEFKAFRFICSRTRAFT